MENLILSSESGKTVTTSLIVAEIFGKRHDNVIADIKKLTCSEQFNLLNFQEIEYLDARNRVQKAYEMTKDGFTFLVMGYTGSRASEYKERFIAQFNRQERIIRKLTEGHAPAALETLATAITSLVESTNARFATIEEQLRTVKPTKKVTVSAPKIDMPAVIDARHRPHQVVDRNGSQMRCIKIEDKDWFAMADVLLAIKCRTSPFQYAKALNRNGKVNAQKIWLFGHSREQWFVSEDGLDMLFSKQ